MEEVPAEEREDSEQESEPDAFALAFAGVGDRFAKEAQAEEVVDSNCCNLGLACGFALIPELHSCYGRNCLKTIHNLCAQQRGWCLTANELNMYCSQECKQGNE